MKTMKAKPEVITFGESMGLFMPNSPKRIEYAHTFEKSFGGAESNVAIGLARLGISSGWFGRLGNDPLGKHILKAIRGEGVDVSRAILTDHHPTGLMLRETIPTQANVYYYRNESAASAMKPEELDEAYIQEAKLLHITGITPALSESSEQTVRMAIQLARKHGVKVSFDPNLRMKLWPLERARSVLLELAQQVDYFIPGWDELCLLYETDDFEQIKEKLAALGNVTILKSKDDFTWVMEKGRTEQVPFFKVDQVIDPVGAGDGFCAGFLAGLMRGFELTEAVKIGNLCGAMMVQATGDWEALPTWDQVTMALENKQHIER